MSACFEHSKDAAERAARGVLDVVIADAAGVIADCADAKLTVRVETNTNATVQEAILNIADSSVTMIAVPSMIRHENSVNDFNG